MFKFINLVYCVSYYQIILAMGTETGFALANMVKTISEDADYKVLTKEEYELLLAHASEASNQGTHTTCTPKSGEINTSLRFQPPATASPKNCLSWSNTSLFQNTLLHNPGNFLNTYIPKLPILSGSEEPQNGEAAYEVWNFGVKCLNNSACLPKHLLFQAISNSLKGTARDMLVPLGEHATGDDILEVRWFLLECFYK